MLSYNSEVTTHALGVLSSYSFYIKAGTPFRQYISGKKSAKLTFMLRRSFHRASYTDNTYNYLH